ncbi:MAG: hypothetical protein WD825_04675 [Gemmatimonadaceae bacterium]
MSSEITINDLKGVVEEIRVKQGKRTRSVIAREYALQENGVYVLKLERVTRFAEGAENKHHSIVLMYRNVRLSEDR